MDEQKKEMLTDKLKLQNRMKYEYDDKVEYETPEFEDPMQHKVESEARIQQQLKDLKADQDIIDEDPSKRRLFPSLTAI